MAEQNPSLPSAGGEVPVTPPPPQSGGPRRDAIVLVVVVAAVAAMITSAVIMGRRAQSPGPGAASVGGALRGDVKGATAPDFELKDLADGKAVKLSDYRGKAVLLNFWATYCEPCKIEMPWFEELNKQYASQGLVVVGVAMDDVGADTVKKFAHDLGVNYQILEGKERVGEAYGGVQFLPTTFYIDRNGKVVDRFFGIISKKEIEDNVKKALAVPAQQAAR